MESGELRRDVLGGGAPDRPARNSASGHASLLLIGSILASMARGVGLLDTFEAWMGAIGSFFALRGLMERPGARYCMRMFPIGDIREMPPTPSSTRILAQEARRLRREAGLTQIDLALLAGVGRRFVSELESGRKPSLRIDKVDAVFRVLGKRLGVVDLESEGASRG